MQDAREAAASASDIFSPQSLRVLVCDSKASARQDIVRLLRECSYQVVDVKSTAEALQVLKEQQARDGKSMGVDLILKEHDPPHSNACRLLGRILEDDVLRTIPVVVMSSQEDRDAMVACLQLGAADYMIKPLRHNELRNLWARVYWWRRAFYLQQQAALVMGSKEHAMPGLKLRYYPSLSQSSDESEETNRWPGEQKAAAVGELERSGEGSAPNGSGSKDGMGNSRAQVGKSTSGGGGNGNSATKQCQGSNQPHVESGQNGTNGNSATKEGLGACGNGNSGNNASTSRQEGAALQGTAEGGKWYRAAERQQGGDLHSGSAPQQPPPLATAHSGVLPAGSKQALVRLLAGGPGSAHLGKEDGGSHVGAGAGSSPALAANAGGAQPAALGNSSGQEPSNGYAAPNDASAPSLPDCPAGSCAEVATGPRVQSLPDISQLASRTPGDHAGFRAHVSPGGRGASKQLAGTKRKAAEAPSGAGGLADASGAGSTGQQATLPRLASHPPLQRSPSLLAPALARRVVSLPAVDAHEVGSTTGLAKFGAGLAHGGSGQLTGSTPTSASDDTILAGSGVGVAMPLGHPAQQQPPLQCSGSIQKQASWGLDEQLSAQRQQQARLHEAAARQSQAAAAQQLAGYGAPAGYGGFFGMPPQAANFGAAMGGPFWAAGTPSGAGGGSEGAQQQKSNMDALSLAYYSQLGAQQMAALAAAQAQGQGSGAQQVDSAAHQAAQLQQAAQAQHQQQQQHHFALMMQHHQAQQQQMFLQQCNEVAASASGMPHGAFPAWRAMHRAANPSSPSHAAQYPFNPFTGAGAGGARPVQSFPNQQHPVQQYAAAAAQQQQQQQAAAANAAKAGQQQQQRKQQNSLHMMSAPTCMDPAARLLPRAGDNNGATSRAPPGLPGAQEQQQKGRLAHNQEQQAMPGPLQAGPRGGTPTLPVVKEEGPKGIIARNADGTPALAVVGSSAPEPTVKERRAQALHKYKQKRKTLCFTKKIRYESRKQLAQARPRVKGQFVRTAPDQAAAPEPEDGAPVPVLADAAEAAGEKEDVANDDPMECMEEAAGHATEAAAAKEAEAAVQAQQQQQWHQQGVANAAAARAAEEDEDDGAVNSSRQEVSWAPGQTLSHHRQAPSGSRLQHSHGISVHPVSGLGEHRADSPTVPAGGEREGKDARTGNGGSDSGSNSPDRVPEGDE